MAHACRAIAAFSLGVVATVTTVFAPVWSQTHVTYCDYFPPPGQADWRVPPGMKVGTFTEVRRGPLWESDLYQWFKKQ